MKVIDNNDFEQGFISYNNINEELKISVNSNKSKVIKIPYESNKI